MKEMFVILMHALLAVFGAMARQLRTQGKTPIRIVSFFSGCFIASFMGVIIYFIAKYFALGNDLAYAMAGLSGWIGPQILDAIAEMIAIRIGLKDKNVK
jgi:hypothetical protein